MSNPDKKASAAAQNTAHFSAAHSSAASLAAPAPAKADAKPELVSFIMSGGIGARLWPLSRQDFPKQFHDFSGHGSMLARTIERLNFINRAGESAAPETALRSSAFSSPSSAPAAETAQNSAKMPIYLIGSESHAEKLQTEISGLPLYGGCPIFEPLGRNTAAAVALAADLTAQIYGSGTLALIVPSDHEIETDAAFWQTIKTGIPAARDGKIVIFGVKPDRPETGYGYIEIAPHSASAQSAGGEIFDILRFKEKPNQETAEHYCQAGNFLWNSGIFLFSAEAMRRAYRKFAPQIEAQTAAALQAARRDIAGLWLPFELYKNIPADSVDYAIMERADNLALVPARFSWNDLGSWQSLLDTPSVSQNRDASGNILVGDIVAIDCERSYLRSENRLLSAVGLKNMAVVATADATFIAPVSQSQNVRKIVAALEKSGRLETKFTPAPDHPPIAGAHRERVRSWLFEETLPLWSAYGADEKGGGFYEILGFDGRPQRADKRMRTMARQVYAFAVAGRRGWGGDYQALIRHGLDFIEKGQTERGGFIALFDADGHIKDQTEDFYDQCFVLLALAYAAAAGEPRAAKMAQAGFAFLDNYLPDKTGGAERKMGYFETPQNNRPWRRANPHMHLLETCLAWHALTGEKAYLERAEQVAELFRTYFFDADNWTLGEYFDAKWQAAAGETGNICEPGHHFEWASLLTELDRHKTALARTQSEAAVEDADSAQGRPPLIRMARKLYASAIANGLNRSTGLAYNSISRFGMPLDYATRSWAQTEIIKAAIALDGNQGPDLKPEIESRVARLFRWHIDAAPKGLWIDAIDKNGRALSKTVPASIFYHLVTALTQYMDFAEQVRAEKS